MDVPTLFTICPLHYSELAIIEDKAAWRKPHINLWHMGRCIVAVTADGTLAGYCGFDAPFDPYPLTITAIMSRVPSAGCTLVDALKARTYWLRASSVFASAEAWWQKQSFALFAAADEDDKEGVVGHYEWWRHEDSRFAETAEELMWEPHRRVAQVIWD